MSQAFSMDQDHRAISIQPITDIEFSGLHLIEASAGTGKTYTLSSLMVRIFLEKYLPNQVIATTFTRAAAAELKTRIRLRIQETYHYLEKYIGLTEKELAEHIQNEQDPLLHYVLQKFSLRISYASERLKLVLDQLDELFIGTLDSFSQKLLREFSFESGRIEQVKITDDAKLYTRQLIHDILRAWIQDQSQLTINFLYISGQLSSEDRYIDVVENSLNFSSAHLKDAPQPELDLQHFESLLTQCQHLSLESIEQLSDYYLEDGQGFSKLSKSSKEKITPLFLEFLPQLQHTIAKKGSYVFFEDDLFSNIQTLFLTDKNLPRAKLFNKCDQGIIDTFMQHPVVVLLQALIQERLQLQSRMLDMDNALKSYLCKEVKKRLPERLSEKGETTFSQQIRSLAEALQGEQGQRFALFIQNRYPLILVDEFQDTNQDQDDMLASIWRHPQRYQNSCMIMVGDRKQAIYGFRGGDMLTFLNAYQDIKNKQGREYRLIYNQRSVKELVTVVDQLFQQDRDFGEGVIYEPVAAGQRLHPSLIDQGEHNPKALRWLKLVDDQAEEAQHVAWKIVDLLNQAKNKTLYIQNHKGEKVAILEDDIAVLSKNHKGLDDVQAQLEYFGIAVNRSARKSVFDDALAHDIAAMLTAILSPFDEACVRRVLLSRLVGLTVHDLKKLELQSDGLSHYITALDQLREIWFQQGFLPAWQQCLREFNVWHNLVKYKSKDNERMIVNLRHLSEILSQHSEHHQGVQSLYHWYLKQLSSPKDRDWELERKLSHASGVQLMTIHQSKGLEFKIVFLLGADKPFKEQNKSLNFSKQTIIDPYNGQNKSQRVVAIANQKDLSDTEIEQHEQRQQAEQHRLWYVALTRASHRVYAVLKDVKEDSKDGLCFWKNKPQPFSHPFSFDEPCLTAAPYYQKAETKGLKKPLHAELLPKQRFYARGKTSFSYLTQHQHASVIKDTLTSTELPYEQAEDEQDLKDYTLNDNMTLVASQQALSLDVAQANTISWIKNNFPKGTQAGNFLHEIFEYIHFQDTSEWKTEIRRRFKNNYRTLFEQLYDRYAEQFPDILQGSPNIEIAAHTDFSARQAHIENELYDQIEQWLKDVLSTHLHQGFQLKQLQPKQFLSECPFYLALADRVLAMRRIEQLYKEYHIEMPEFLDAHSARYLNGSIDLIYFDGERYHIADYKSNYLGALQQDYHQDAIAKNMSQSSYWLQAGLYLVALHRYLKAKLAHYDIEAHLGGATYLYLRGMNGQTQQGYYYWKPSNEFVLRLDAILGYYAEDKSE